MSKQTIKYPCGCEFEIIDGDKSKIKFNPNVENLPLDCPKTWDVFARGDTKGVFQLESRLGSSLSKKLKPTNIEHLAALISIMRPGALEALIDGKSITERYIDRKNGVEEVTYLHPALKNALKSTYAVSIYQEQSIQISRDIAGFTLEQGDILRKGVAKKLPAVIAQVKKEFIEGCKKTKIVDDEMAHTIFDIIEKSQRYSFNKCITLDTTVIDDKRNIRTIEDINIGDKILSPNGYTTVVNKFDNGIQDVYKITTTSGKSIKCTINHKFLCSDNKVRPLYDILKHNDKPFKQWKPKYFLSCYDKKYHIWTIEDINSITHIGMEQTVDIEVDNESHLFYGNGIAISNSHAVSYALNSYLTAYVKAHFPRAFFTSYLRYSKDKQKPLDEIKELVDNAKLNKIKISPVDFRIRNPHFKSIDGVIYFGFTDIKGIGDSSINIIENNVPIIEKQLNKTCDKWTWLDFLLFMSESLNASCVRSLICCGALDYLMVPRTRMLFEYDILDRLTKRELLWLKNRYFSNNVKTFTDILELLALAPSGNKNGCGCSNKPRIEKVLALIQTLKNPPYVLEDSRSWTYGVEKELMGTSLTCDGLDDSAKNYANFSCQDFLNKRKWTGPIIIAGILSGVKNITTKKHQLMAFAQISDMGGSVDLVIFPDSFEENRKFLYDDNKVLVVGHRGDRDNSFIVDKVIDA